MGDFLNQKESIYGENAQETCNELYRKGTLLDSKREHERYKREGPNAEEHVGSTAIIYFKRFYLRKCPVDPELNIAAVA